MKESKKGDKYGHLGSGSADAAGSSHSPSVSSEVIRQVVDRAVDDLCEKLGLSKGQVLQLLKQRKDSIQVPVSLFANTELSGLELVCKYLKDNISLSFSGIAKVLNRDYRTVWTTYSIANRKHKSVLVVPKSEYFFPVSVVANRDLSVLEAIVSFMKDELGLRFNEIAAAMHRDQRNIWTVYSRAKKKLQGKNGK